MENKESFTELYTRLYNENFNELENMRSKNAKIIKIAVVIIAIVIIAIFGFQIMSFLGVRNVAQSDSFGSQSMMSSGFLVVGIFFILIIFILLLTIVASLALSKQKAKSTENQKQKSYQVVFKEKIIAPVIKYVFPDSQYYYDSGLTEEEYNKGEWEHYDRYDSEDKIVTNINVGKNQDIQSNLVISQVHTEDRRRDKDGNTHYVTLFYGLSGYIKLPKEIGCYLKVIKNEFKLLGSSKDRIEMDMSDFEKIFDVKTDDRIKAMQILTADIMSEFIELVKISKVKYEFYINNDMMYIRFHTGEVFEPSVFGKSMQYENLKKYCDIVNMVKNVTEHICNVIMDTEL